jgi:hypothetical protein
VIRVKLPSFLSISLLSISPSFTSTRVRPTGPRTNQVKVTLDLRPPPGRHAIARDHLLHRGFVLAIEVSIRRPGEARLRRRSDGLALGRPFPALGRDGDSVFGAPRSPAHLPEKILRIVVRARLSAAPRRGSRLTASLTLAVALRGALTVRGTSPSAFPSTGHLDLDPRPRPGGAPYVASGLTPSAPLEVVRSPLGFTAPLAPTKLLFETTQFLEKAALLRVGEAFRRELLRAVRRSLEEARRLLSTLLRGERLGRFGELSIELVERFGRGLGSAPIELFELATR